MKLFTFVVLACFAVCNCAETSKDNKESMVSSSYGGGSSGGSGGYGGGGYSAPAAPPASGYSAPAAPPAAAYGSPAAPSYQSAQPAQQYSAPGPSKPVAHAPISIPAPPCPRNYLFSCSPNLAPAPCNAAASHSHGPAGAYSQYMPIYAIPPSVRYY